MAQIRGEFRLHNWLTDAFRGEIPETVTTLMESQEKRENVVEEMFTQLPPETRDVMERLYEMHRADTELMYTVVAELFRRHLSHHR